MAPPRLDEGLCDWRWWANRHAEGKVYTEELGLTADSSESAPSSSFERVVELRVGVTGSDNVAMGNTRRAQLP